MLTDTTSISSHTSLELADTVVLGYAMMVVPLAVMSDCTAISALSVVVAGLIYIPVGVGSLLFRGPLPVSNVVCQCRLIQAHPRVFSLDGEALNLSDRGFFLAGVDFGEESAL